MSANQTEPRDYLDRLNTEYDSHTSAIDELVNRALAEERDLTDDENAECERHQREAEALQPQIQRWKKLRETRQAVTVEREQLPPAASGVKIVERSGQVAAAVDDDGKAVRQVFRTAGDMTHALMLARRGDVVQRELVQRALAKATTADVPGLLPTTYVGEIRGKIDGVRPIVNSGRKIDLPRTGMEVRRPKITQHTTVGKQNGEKTELPSQALKVGFDTISLSTYGGAVNMSIQEAERTDPSALNLTYEDLGAQYGIATETVAATELDSLTPIAAALDIATATNEQVLAAIYNATASIYAATNGRVPDKIYAGMGWFSKLGALTMPVNPQNGLANADPGTMALRIGSLTAVLSPRLDSDFLAVGVSDSLEIYENQGAPVQLRALEVGILGYEIGVYGLFACEVWPEAFVRLDAVA